MRKFNKLASLMLVLTIILSMGSMAFGQGVNESDIKTGFYVKDAEGNNIFIDIYTFLNNKEEYLSVINKGLGNVLFVHQNGTGATLEQILTKDDFRQLDLTDFEETYKKAGKEEVIKPRDSFYTLTANLDKESYNVDEFITLSGRVLRVKDGLGNVDLTLKVEKSTVNTPITVEQFKTDVDGKFTATFQLPEDVEAGTYKVTVSASNPVNKFKVLDLVIAEEPVVDPIPEAIIGDIVNKLERIFSNIDRDDKVVIGAAKAKIATIEDGTWDLILADLLTKGVVAKFQDEADAKLKLKSAIEELAEIQYSVDNADLKGSLMNYAETHLPTFRAIFGNDESAETIFGFIKDIMTNIPNAITPTQGNEIVKANNEELIVLIEDIIKTTVEFTLDQDQYTNFKGRLSQVGLSVDTLLGVRSKLATEIDADNQAQRYLINAYARSEAVVTGPRELKVGETVEYTLKVFGKDVSTLATWAIFEDDGFTESAIATIAVDEKVEVKGKTVGKAWVWVFRGEAKDMNWIDVFEINILPADN